MRKRREQMITKTVTVSTTYTLKYDPESPEFKQALDDYTGCIDRQGDEDSVLKQIAFALTNSSYRAEFVLVEGVGKVCNQGAMPDKLYCGVEVVDIDEDTEIY